MSRSQSATALFLASWSRHRSARSRRRFVPRLLSLEDRTLPSTITVANFADGGPGSGSLRDAVLQFNADTGTADDTIQLQAGTYSLTIRNVGNRHETAGLTGDLNITQTSHRWIIQGAGPSTIIDASQLQDRVFEIVYPGTQVIFQDLVMQGGLAQENGADGALAGTTDAVGGGILNNGGHIVLDHVVVQNNVARGGNGRDYYLPADGYNASGGGVYSTGGSVAISDSTIARNQAIGGNGAAEGLVGGTGGTGAGGGIYTTGGLISLTSTALANNVTRGGAGGDGAYSTRVGSGGNGGNGGVGQGGGVYAAGGMLSLTNATISSNTTSGGHGGHGGGPSNQEGGNGGVGQGGGIYAAGGMLSLTNATISTNILSGGTGGDGGVGFYGVGGNGGAAQGGALYVVSGFTAHVILSTIATNQATGGTHGVGRVGNGSDGPATGGGMYNQGMLQTDDTILAGNTVTGPGTNSSPDLFGNLGSLGHNLIANTQGGIGFDPTDLRNVNPLLGPLHDNGGPTFTMALLPGSPGLNAGDPVQLGMPDQRGVVRTGGVNIGAFQASATAFVVSAPGMVQSGGPFDVIVTAVDPFGQLAVGYTGTVTFSTTDPDPGVILPADYAFQFSDAGSVTFSAAVTLITPGAQTVAVTDTADNTIAGNATVTVGGTAPGPGRHSTSPTPAQSSTGSEPSTQEGLTMGRWLTALHEPGDPWVPVFRTWYSTQSASDALSVDFFGADGFREAVW